VEDREGLLTGREVRNLGVVACEMAQEDAVAVAVARARFAAVQTMHEERDMVCARALMAIGSMGDECGERVLVKVLEDGLAVRLPKRARQIHG
jgi:hypothetical protein